MSAVEHLVALLVDPVHVATVPDAAWSGILSVARAEMMIGTLGHCLAGQELPLVAANNLAAAARAADQAQVQALWEAEMCRRALAPLGIEPILLKGTAYAAAGLPNATGRNIGDCDILVPRDRLDDVETALLNAGWEWVKDDPYDQAYYRDHMHELPPLIHKDRDRMIDVHHTNLPLTARPRPDAGAMVAAAIPPSRLREGLGEGQSIAGRCMVTHPPQTPRASGRGTLILSPADMVIHAATHAFADGDLAGGLRNLYDIDRLLRHFSAQDAGFWSRLTDRARHHGLWFAVHSAARLAHAIFATPIPATWNVRGNSDFLFRARILARDDWGREARPLLRLGFYIRSHLLRMPLPMLLRHLWVKWRRG